MNTMMVYNKILSADMMKFEGNMDCTMWCDELRELLIFSKNLNYLNKLIVIRPLPVWYNPIPYIIVLYVLHYLSNSFVLSLLPMN